MFCQRKKPMGVSHGFCIFHSAMLKFSLKNAEQGFFPAGNTMFLAFLKTSFVSTTPFENYFLIQFFYFRRFGRLFFHTFQIILLCKISQSHAHVDPLFTTTEIAAKDITKYILLFLQFYARTFFANKKRRNVSAFPLR